MRAVEEPAEVVGILCQCESMCCRGVCGVLWGSCRAHGVGLCWCRVAPLSPWARCGTSQGGGDPKP